MDKDSAKIRNSPRLLSEMVYYLSDDQKDWVKKSGFEALLDFKLEMLPSKLASKVLQVFDHISVSLRIEHGNIYITGEDVFDVIGLPYGGKSVEPVINDITNDRMTEWLNQFKNGQITPSKVLEKVREETRVTDMFKVNFLTLMSNVLIGTQTHSYVDREMVRLENLDNCVTYDWSHYLIKNLVEAKDKWNRISSDFFKGSLIFLTVR